MKERSRLARRLSLASCVASGFAALALGGVSTAAAQETLAASCQPTENIFHGATGDRLFAQPFNSQVSGNLTSAELRLRNFSGNGDWMFQIRTAQPSGSFSGELEPTPTVLASATLPDASVPDGMDSTEIVVFPTPAAVVAGGDYALAVTRPAATDANSLAVAAHTPHTDCPSRMYDSNNGGANWSGQDLDTLFRVFITPPAPDVPVLPVTPATTAKKKCKKHKKKHRAAETKTKKCKKKRKQPLRYIAR